MVIMPRMFVTSRRNASRLLLVSIVASILSLSSSCSIHRHIVGTGPNGIGTDSMRQYYVFFGLLRLNEADSQRLTDGMTSYEVVTKLAFTDMLLWPFLLPLTVTSRTVTVNR